jgi:hypothetical protein
MKALILGRYYWLSLDFQSIDGWIHSHGLLEAPQCYA